MSTKYFNFNNEAALTPVEVDDETGVVSFTADGHTATFDSLQEFAEFYARARNVVDENLKNWVMTTDGDQFAFVLRAGTAGLDADSIADMARGLQAAGYTPEQIGRAIASAQVTDKEQAKVQEAEEATNSFRDELVEFIDDAEPLTRAILFDRYGIDKHEGTAAELVEAMANDESIRHTVVIETEYDEDTDEEEEIEVSVDGIEAVYAVTQRWVNEITQRLNDVYPDLPTIVAYDVDGQNLGENATVNDNAKLQKAVFAAKIARRQLEVAFVDNADNDDDTTVGFHRGFLQDVDYDYIVAYHVKGVFYIVEAD